MMEIFAVKQLVSRGMWNYAMGFLGYGSNNNRYNKYDKVWSGWFLISIASISIISHSL